MKNGKYLDSLSSDKKSRILKNIATHYGISVADAEDEVRDDDAEMLYEYIANDNSLKMEVYNDMERGKYAKGGGISKSTKYVPNRDIKSLMVVLQGELKSLKGTDIVDGVYVKTGRSSATKNSSNDANAIIEKLKRIQKSKDYDAELGLDKNDIQELIDAGFDAKDIEIIYGGYKAPKVYADTEFGDTTSGLVASDSGFQKRSAKRIAESGKKGMFEIGLKYPSFDWKQIVEYFKINLKPKIKIVDSGSYQYKYEIYLGSGIAIGHSIAYKRNDKNDWEEDGSSVGVVNFNKPSDFQKSRNYKSGFNGGYWGIVTKNKKDIYYIIDTLLKQTSGYVKDVDLFANGLGGIGVSDVSDLQFKKGGKMKKGKKEPMIVRSYFEDEAIDYAKGGKLSESQLKYIQKEFEENEDNNAHSENVVLLAKYFGSSTDLKEAKKILAQHEKEGYLSTENGKKRRKLEDKLFSAWNKAKGFKFAKGGEVDLSGNNYRVLFTKKDSDIVYGEEIYANSENEARKKFNNKHKGKGRTIEYISTPSAYYSDGGKMEDNVVRKGDYWIVKNQGNTDFPFLVNSRDGAIVYKAESKKDATDWIKQRSDEYEDDEITTGFNYSIGGL